MNLYNRTNTTKSFFIGFVIFLILMIIGNKSIDIVGRIFNGNKDENSIKKDKLNDIFEPSFKESSSNANKIEHLDSISMIYSNFKYGFSMDFPDNWNFDRGIAEHTVIRAGQKDSFMLAAIVITELKDKSQNSKDIWELWDDQEIGMADHVKNGFQKALNSDLLDFTWRKVFVNSRKAIETKSVYILKELDYEFEMLNIGYTITNSNNFIYNVTIKTPKFFYEMNPSRFDYMINNFVFL